MYVALVLSLFVSFMSAFQEVVINMIVGRMYTCSQEVRSRRGEMKKLRQEMDELSITEDFVKYTKLQRKLTKLLEVDKSSGSQRLHLKAVVLHASQMVLVISSVVMFWTLRYTPVIHLPEDWTYPFGYLLSWPSYETGAIGFPVWFLMTNTAAKFTANLFS